MRIALAVVMVIMSTGAWSRDLGQWAQSDPALSAWFESLKQPDNPYLSCCGESDAYWADSYEVTPDGNYVAIITDERPDEPLKRRHREVGTRIVVPKHKLKFDQGNPTGHGIIFIRPTEEPTSADVYCYLAPGGV